MEKRLVKRLMRIGMVVCFLGFIGNLRAQDPMVYLEENYPQLTGLYRSELKECHAHYIFAVDVSLSMCKFEENVKPALISFFKAVPEGDRVTIIPFATAADANRMGFDVTINRETRKTLIDMVARLYPDRKEQQQNRAKYFDTNIYLAQQALAKSIQENPKYDVNFVFYISDMLNCPSNNVDRLFSSDEMDKMKTLLRSARNKDVQVRAFALELPKSGSMSGFVVPQLKEVYREWDVELEEQYVPDNAHGAIREWFETQKDKIMFMKLQSIIIRENKANPMNMKTTVDIDGNVTADINWKASKLYPTLKIDTTFIKTAGFDLDPNEDYTQYSNAGEMNGKIRLGKIKHQNIGFHQFIDTVFCKGMLPVPYQDELDRVLEGREQPDMSKRELIDRSIFTFPLPLWATVMLLALLLLYIIGVINAIIRNKKYCFKGNITVYDNMGMQIGDTRRLGKQKTDAVLTFGQGGTPSACKVEDAEWAFTLQKKNGNPLLVFQKPKFVWKSKKGYTAIGKAQSGELSYANKTMVKIKCGPRRSEDTHSVKIVLVR